MPSKPPSQLRIRKAREQNDLADRILRTGFEMLACSRCKESGRLCIVASEESRRCAHCVRAGKSCDVDGHVGSAPSTGEWKNLAAAEDRLDAEIERADEAMAEIAARSARLRKQKKLLKRRGAEMIKRGLRSLEELEQLEAAEAASKEPPIPAPLTDPSSFAEFLPDFSDPSFWADIPFSVDSGGTPSGGPGS